MRKLFLHLSLFFILFLKSSMSLGADNFRLLDFLEGRDRNAFSQELRSLERSGTFCFEVDRETRAASSEVLSASRALENEEDKAFFTEEVLKHFARFLMRSPVDESQRVELILFLRGLELSLPERTSLLTKSRNTLGWSPLVYLFHHTHAKFSFHLLLSLSAGIEGIWTSPVASAGNPLSSILLVLNAQEQIPLSERDQEVLIKVNTLLKSQAVTLEEKMNALKYEGPEGLFFEVLEHSGYESSHHLVSEFIKSDGTYILAESEG